LARRSILAVTLATGVFLIHPLATFADTGSGRALEADQSWTVRAETTLQTTLANWAAREGWDLVWDAKNDYRIRASADLGTDFLSAVRALSDAVNMTSPDLTVTLYLGNRVIHVRDTTLTHN
jgi:hypothetical protein